MKYILSIDAGTTSSRSIIFDKDGNQIGISQYEFTQICSWNCGALDCANKKEKENKRTIKEEKTDTTLTPVGRHYGTPMYMPPEVAKGDPNIDGRTDVFSLGIILFEMMTLQFFSKDFKEFLSE